MKLAEASPERALRWLSSMTGLPGEISAASQGRVLARWAGQEPEVAGNWLADQPDDPNYDAMARSYSNAVAPIDAERALDWAQSIRDEEQRKAALIEVARHRIKTHGEDSIEDLRLAGLTEDQISQARQPPQRSFTFNAGGLALRGGGDTPLNFVLGNLNGSTDTSPAAENAPPRQDTPRIPSPPNR
ncbi:MAG: hypothetical protein GWO24_13515 [Akkermansiaceae bacterium]|nr:hypothetical protein [Akkermansiaceae bacterium]